MEARLERVVLWRNVLKAGAEYCTLSRNDGGWLWQGTAVAAWDERTPLQVSYEIQCDRGWQTREAKVEKRAGGAVEAMHLRTTGNRRWWVNEKERVELLGCVDVDLGASPATNTLPIRRLGLAVGASAEVTAAWVKFPEMVVQTLAQRYTRVGEFRYRYESNGGRFQAELEVDELGLVKSYKGVWERMAVLGAHQLPMKRA